MQTRGAVANGIDNPGLDVFLKGKRLALITGPTGVDRRLRSTVAILRERYKLMRLFAPEHGLRGEAQAGERVDGYTDPETRLTVHSLYAGEHGRNIPPELLADIDALVFDMQDVGARFYTYLYTLADAMVACAENNIEMVVLDRVNPIGLSKIEGAALERQYASFVGRYNIPARYALTIGEFARYINKEENIGCRLTVAPCVNYSRNVSFNETGLCWVLPSPNMPSPRAALAYIGTCLFEGTNVSEGRGTVKPFEIIGAPWLNAKKALERLSRYANGMDGAVFGTVYFRPTFSKFQNELCEGVQLHITDDEAFTPFRTGLLLLQAIRETHPAFEFLPNADGPPFITRLLGSGDILNDDFNAERFIDSQKGFLNSFGKKSAEVHIY